jgi:hypothetical protein
MTHNPECERMRAAGGLPKIFCLFHILHYVRPVKSTFIHLLNPRWKRFATANSIQPIPQLSTKKQSKLTIWCKEVSQHYFFFLTRIVESLTSSNISSPAFSFKSSTTWEGIVINKLLPILRSFSLISISNIYPRDILKYKDIIIISRGYHSDKVEL